MGFRYVEITFDNVQILYQTEDKKHVIRMEYILRRRGRPEPEIDKVEPYLDRNNMRFYPVKYKQEYDVFWNDLPPNFGYML